jgi:cardiolipin synthase
MLRHLPNVLTTMRLAAAPATAGLLVAGHFNAAFGLFALAGLSDAADGFLAKRFGLASRLGRILDPIADKALMVAAFVTLAVIGNIPLWLVGMVILRDILILLGLAIAAAVHAPIGVQPLFIGKLFTAFQIGYIALHLASLAFGFPLWLVPADAYIVGGLAVASGCAYLSVWAKAMRTAWARDGSRA